MTIPALAARATLARKTLAADYGADTSETGATGTGESLTGERGRGLAASAVANALGAVIHSPASPASLVSRIGRAARPRAAETSAHSAPDLAGDSRENGRATRPDVAPLSRESARPIVETGTGDLVTRALAEYDAGAASELRDGPRAMSAPDPLARLRGRLYRESLARAEDCARELTRTLAGEVGA